MILENNPTENIFTSKIFSGYADRSKKNETERITFEQTYLNNIFDADEFNNFKYFVKILCEQEKDVVGVLLTGSLIQRNELPVIPNNIRFEGSAKKYHDICMYKKRKLNPHPDSDLDVWVCTRDCNPYSKIIRTSIEQKAVGLLHLLEEKPVINNSEFDKLTNKFFGEYYKQTELYSDSWKVKNSCPWSANYFKDKFMDSLNLAVPDIDQKLKDNFLKRELSEFVEIRAYPVSTFNIKPHLMKNNGTTSREPFPYYIKDLVSLERNCIVIYADKNYDDLPYPFAVDGILLGGGIAEQINWTETEEEYTYVKRFEVND